MDPNDPFIQSCKNFRDYPKCLMGHNALSHTARAYQERLVNRTDDLFNERRAAVDFLDIEHSAPACISRCVNNLPGLKLVLRPALKSGRSDPLCRYVFLHAPHSRAPLLISFDMFNFLFTYHQIMAPFLDFVFPFGKQVYPRDFHFSGFREESRLVHGGRDAGIPELGRSGIGLKLCYNLRSVERSNEPSLPWSIRQTAVYHDFDLETGRTLWVIVKGNKLIKKRINDSFPVQSAPRIDSRIAAFSESLASHSLMCDWAGENWRWYINDLEDKLQDLTRDILATPVNAQVHPPSADVASDPLGKSPLSRSSTFPLLSRATTNTLRTISRVSTDRLSFKSQPRSVTPSYLSRTPTIVHKQRTCHPTFDSSLGNLPRSASSSKTSRSNQRPATALYGIRQARSAVPRFWSKKGGTRGFRLPDVEMGAPCPPDNIVPAQEPPSLHFQERNDVLNEVHTFSDLQRILYLEEKAQEALLVLKMNKTVLGELREHYSYVASHANFPDELVADCHIDIARFERSVLGVEKDLWLLQSRTETLLTLLANRKGLLDDIFQFQSREQAQGSANQMESMTKEMHEIAKKTKQETVSMRVITSVTLFFLPATFIATFMSTDILKFENGESEFQLKGLGTYLAIALPLTVLTFFAWYMIYLFARKREESTMRKTYREKDQKLV